MKKTVLFDAKSEYSRYQIVDMIYNGREARVLFSGGDAPQSGIALDDDPELLFNYNQRFMEIAESIQPSSVLVIGGGAFTLPKALLERFNDIRIDAVEIDPLLPELAEEYFELPRDTRLNIVVGDGLDYIKQCHAQYDMIVVDAFSEYNIPAALLAVETVREYSRCLNNNGVIAVNFIARYHTYRPTLAHQLMATFQSVLNKVELYQSDYHAVKQSEQNLMLVASKQAPITLDYLQSAPVSLLFTPEGVIT